MLSHSPDVEAPPRDAAADAQFIEGLRKIVGDHHLLTGADRTRRYRTGFRFGGGAALAVARPGSLVEQWRVLKACAAADKIVIVQASNTGLTGGSTPDGDDYDRDVVIVSTTRLARIRLIDQGHQVICLPGATLFQLEKALKPLRREPHSVIGSSCIGASVVGGVCNNSGGTLIRRGPAYTEMALYARVNEGGEVELINHLGLSLGNDPETILERLDRDAFADADIEPAIDRRASDHRYAEHVRDVDADSPARYNADPNGLFEAAGSGGKVMVFAVRLDTFPMENETRVFYIGTNRPEELTRIRRHMLADFKSLPVSAEYMHRDAFDIAETYGKDTFLAIHYFGTEWLPTLFAIKERADSFTAKWRFLPAALSDRLLQAVSRMLPSHLPRRMKEYRDRYEHHLAVKMAGGGIDEGRRYLNSIYPSPDGAFFECSDEEGNKALLHRFATAGAAIRYRAIHPAQVEDIVSLDVALRRNDQDWIETLPNDMSAQLVHKLYYGHFFCHVFHQDYIVRRGHDTLEFEHRMWKLLDARGAQYPAEHNVGHLYQAKPALREHYKSLDPCNCFNPGIGQTSKFKRWGAQKRPADYRCD
jgi:D-lactate dehydrogenase (quinone)